MYVAMNRFTVTAQNAAAFEALWLGRDSYLKDADGFVEFQLLKGPEAEGVTLRVSHSVGRRGQFSGLDAQRCVSSRARQCWADA